MSEYRALCGHRGTCIVCGERATDTHMNQAHAAPIIAKAIRDYKDGLRRADEDTSDYTRRPLTDAVLANIGKVSKPFVIGYREGLKWWKRQQALEEMDRYAGFDQDEMDSWQH